MFDGATRGEVRSEKREKPLFKRASGSRASSEAQGRKCGGIWGLTGHRMTRYHSKEVKIVSAPHNSGQPRTTAGEHQFRQLRELITLRNSPEPSRVGRVPCPPIDNWVLKLCPRAYQA